MPSATPSQDLAARAGSRNGIVEARVEDQSLVDRRRGQILAAALTLFGSQDFYAVTIKDIAKAAGISTGLIYQYFKTKEDVLLLVLLERMDRYWEEVAAVAERVDGPLERFHAAFVAYCRVVDESKEATVLAYRSFRSLDAERRKHVLEREKETHRLLAGFVRDCQSAGVLREVDVDLICSQIASMAHGWALQSWRFPEDESVNDYVRRSFDLLANGILTVAGKRAAANFAES